ncbi:MAG: bifunctional 4-hydroxy-3-methylbut-2-enyl diphosphate reductase/30S ribosomal protein S1 [Firmicutes bacterium]|nr:bifunctional 4-hydroxy-3-methylbut-2-enyl diphosphate reductase/30S ribosomal protein S1 [Bacillota bacterium]
MEYRLAEHSGFCAGVRRAIDMAVECSREAGHPITTLGPLIHNADELARLGDCVRSVNTLDEVEHDTVLIRAHGVAPQVMREAEAKGLTVVDATCPLVRKAQLKAQELAEAGYRVVIVGEPGHPEVQGLLGWAGEGAVVVPDPAAAAELDISGKVGVISQTTQTKENFTEICMILARKADGLRRENTICAATRARQQSVRELAEWADLMIVLGGKSSANTKRLALISAESCANVLLAERARDLDWNIVRGAGKIGITAGASTPDWIIEEVIVAMEEMEKVVIPEENITEPEVALDEATPVAAEEVAEDKASVVEEDDQDAFAREYGMMQEIRRGSRVKGVIVQVKQDEMLVDIGSKSEGVLTSAELSREEAGRILELFHVGDEIEVLVIRRENQEGYPVLSKRRIDQEQAWDKLIAKQAADETVTGKVVEVVKGGLLVDVGIRGFIPASLVSLGYVEDLASYVGKELTLKIIECDKHSNKLVLSAKHVLRRLSKEQKAKTWAEIEEGQTRKGTVRRLTKFGAFVDIGGVDGLLHVSEMAWYRVNHPSDLLKEGDELDVYVLAVDQENEKISLGLKQLTPNPWSIAAEKYPEGATLTAKVMRTTSFGAFLEIEPGVEGLVHISQLAHKRVEKTEDVVKPGDEVEVKVLGVDPEAKRMSLSIKATQPAPVEEAPAEEAVEEAPVEE